MATLKLRVRAASGGPTMRVQVPWPFTLQALKDVISPLIMQPASSFSLSLNKKAAIDGPATASLSDFGVINGDLLFYIATEGDSSAANVPVAHSNEEIATESASMSASATAPSTSHSPLCTRATVVADVAPIVPTVDAPKKNNDAPTPMSAEPPPTFLAAPADQEAKNAVNSAAMQFSGENAMEVETEEKAGPPLYRVSVPDLLQHVLSVEYGNVKERPELLVLAVHAVMLETGFVLSSGAIVGSPLSPGLLYGLPTGWSHRGGQVNLAYTLPEIKSRSEATGGDSRPFVGDTMLRSQIVGNALVVYGVTAGRSRSEVHRVSLPVSSFLAEEESVPKGGSTCSAGAAGDAVRMVVPDRMEPPQHATDENVKNVKNAMMIGMFRGVLKLWKEVKDGMSLPLLVCLCEQAGLPPPASLLILPTELKVKVLELLPAAALARIGCVCSELKFLAGGDNLWKVRFKEDFAGTVFDRFPPPQGWKNAFAREWLRRKRRREQEQREADRHVQRVPAFGVRIRQRSYVPHFPGVIGGDYDMFPGLRGGGGLGGAF